MYRLFCLLIANALAYRIRSLLYASRLVCKPLDNYANICLNRQTSYCLIGRVSGFSGPHQFARMAQSRYHVKGKVCFFMTSVSRESQCGASFGFLGGETSTWLPNEGLFHGGCAVRAIGYSYVTLQGFVPFMQISQPRCRPSSRDTQRRGHYSRWLVSEAPPNDVMNLSRGQQDPTQVCRRH